jgi:hypothetical protein
MVLAAAAAMAAEPKTPQTPHYGRAEIKGMIRDAHTPQQYQVLAAYFRARQQDFRAQARSEAIELERRMQFATVLAAKYPRPVDSSRNRYEYFRYEGDKMAQKAAYFESLSATNAQPAEQ